MVNAIKNSIHLAKIFAFAVSIVIFFFPTVAMADSFSSFGKLTAFSVDINNGNLNLNIPGIQVKETEDIVAAVSLFKTVEGKGKIDTLKITKDDGTVALNCAPFNVNRTEDLLKSCGTSNIKLTDGYYRYEATGHDFTPDGEDEFAIDLFKG